MTITIASQIIMAIFSVLMSIISFLISRNYTEMKATLTKMSNDIMQTKIELTELRASMMNDTRVKEIVELELIRHNQNKD